MATPLRRNYAAQKPPAGSTINWGHPLARGLTFCVLFNERAGRPIDLVSAMPAGSGIGPWYPQGAMLATNGNVSFPVAKNLASTGAYTARLKFWPISFGGDYATLFSKGIGGGCEVAVFLDPTGATWKYVRLGNAGVPISVPMGLAPSATIPVWYDALFVAKAASVAGYVNGVLKGTSSNIGDVVAFGSTVAFGHDSGGGGSDMVEVVDQFQLWNRALTGEEAAWLQAEPYAFITSPGPKILYFDLGAFVAPGNSVTGGSLKLHAS